MQVASDFFSTLGANHFNETTNLIFIEENHGSNSSFMIGSFMWQAKAIESAEVILLNCHNSVQHYQYLLNKWGHVLRHTSQKSNFVTVSLTEFSEVKNGTLDMCKLFDALVKNCEQLKDQKTYLIIDDLSYLLMLSSLQECVHFSRQLLQLLIDFKLLKIIVCSHVSESDEELLIISKLFHHFSNFVLSVVPLKSGFSSEVTGHLKIIHKNKFRRYVNRYNFRLDDRKFTLNPHVI